MEIPREGRWQPGGFLDLLKKTGIRAIRLRDFLRRLRLIT
jgi:hypothetical protein